MRRDDDDTPGLREVAQEPDDAVDLDVVEVGGRFVGEHQRGVVHECPRDRDPLLLATGHAAGLVRDPFGQADLPQQLRRAGAGGAAARCPRHASAASRSPARSRLGTRLNAWNTIPTVSLR